MEGNRQQHRSALITGASGGIGAAFAKVLPASTRLLLAGRNEDRLRAVGASVGAERVTHVTADLATAEGRANLIAHAQRMQLDLLVCNAGRAACGSFLESPISAALNTVSVNVLAVMELLHALLPDMIARARRDGRRAGAIIVSSTAAFALAPIGIACYAASKSFVQHLAESLAAECRADPLDVLALCPTYTRTRFFSEAGLPPPAQAMEPEDVAREGLSALGRETVHLCGLDRRPQVERQLAAYNPALSHAGGFRGRIAWHLLQTQLPR